MKLGVEGRWPPVYDAEGLNKYIRELTKAEDFDARFWSLKPLDDPPVCQGDIIALDSQVPVIDSDGVPAASEEYRYWLVMGNTCDLDRDLSEVTWAQIAPLNIFERTLSKAEIQAFRSYQYARRFYVPPFPGYANVHGFADFTRTVALHRRAFGGSAKVVARMQMPAWVLLNSCLVRYLARGDGRNDP